MKEERSIFNKIEKRIRKQSAIMSKIEQAFAKELNITLLKLKINKTPFGTIECNVTMDDYSVTDIDIDQYNNLSFEKCPIMPIEYLEKFRRLLNGYLEHETSYYHRSGTSFFIQYFEDKHDKLDMEYTKKMCAIDDVDNESSSSNRDDSGFREWLVGTYYTTDGNLQDYKTWKYDNFKKEEKKK